MGKRRMGEQRDIVLATANARYSHTSLALRCVAANLGALVERTAIMEFTIDDNAADIAEAILARHPRVVGLSVYLWNVTLLTRVAAVLKGVAPSVRLVIGGPEVSYESEAQAISGAADVIVSGEGEVSFRQIVSDILENETGRNRPEVGGEKQVIGAPPDLERVGLPYDLYTDEDIAHRVIYVEASRGCPFGCEFCLSSLDTKVRRFPEDRILSALSGLWERGGRRFKFIDRSFHFAVSSSLLDWFLEKRDADLFLHFELIPDRLPAWAMDKLAVFPPGAVQLEAGLQTLDDRVAERIGRKQDTAKALDTLRRLRRQTGVHIHSDLVAGLPGESLESFGAGFDRLFALGLQEIQVGILKRLRGAPIARHEGAWKMVYNPDPPYDILQNRDIDFNAMQRIKRFAKFHDLICNRGNFNTFIPLIWRDGSPFDRLMALSDWLFDRTGRTHSIALNHLAELLFEHATTVGGCDTGDAANRIAADFYHTGRRGLPKPVAGHVTRPPADLRPPKPDLPARQARHRRDT